MTDFNILVNILINLFGESKDHVTDDGQIQFNCPACADDNGLEHGDGKFNLEINILRGKYRCWACEYENNMKGNLSSLIKKYGGDSTLSEFRNEVEQIKKSKEYEFNAFENNIVFEEDEEFTVNLPKNCHEFKLDNNKKEFDALKYLIDRGINEKQIKKHKLKYTTTDCPNRNFRNRIIIPSYDKFGNLNYYTGRDYSGKSFSKYYNYEKSNRKEIIFNENLINWDADIYLVEGPTDHIAIPNSIPLLGKAINFDFYIIECLLYKSSQDIIVFLDNDAKNDSNVICELLCNLGLQDRIKIIDTEKLRKMLVKYKNYDDKKLDPSKLYKLYGHRGVAWALKSAAKYDSLTFLG